ncbi:MAG: hypothetical protein WCF57_02140 [Pyrinomonadaceae bacterium]
MEQQLIALYLRVYWAYDTQLDLKYQRLSNFRPQCTDEDILTIYLFGHMQGFHQQRRIYDYTCRHWRAWFPALPSYQAFNRRLNRLAPAFERLIGNALKEPIADLAEQADRLVDSCPVMLAKWPRCGAAHVDSEVADQGYCSSKCNYYRVKLHVIALRRAGHLLLLALVHLSRASQRDLTALRELNPKLGRGYLFGDKAYADEELK